MNFDPLPYSGKLPGGEPPRRRGRRRVVGVVLALAAIAALALLGSRSAGQGIAQLLARLSPATPTPTATPTASPTPTPSPTPWAPVAGPVRPPAPFFRFGRPFATPDLALPERSFLYGTDAEGTLLLHHGNDLVAPLGTDVVAVADGTVVYAGEDDTRRFGPTNDFFGRLVVLRHHATADASDPGAATRPLSATVAAADDDGAASGVLFSLYGHLSATAVRYGQNVRRGDVVGAVGMAGIALGPHLHLEVRTRAADYEATRNPLLYVAPVPGTGAVVARVRDSVGKPLFGEMVGLFEAGPPERWVAQARTYPPDHVHPSPPWDESVVFSDLPPGRYALAMEHHSARIRTEFDIAPDGVTFAVLAP